MVLPHSYTSNVHRLLGFTLFEVVITVSIFSGVLAATLFVTTSMYQAEILRTERSVILKLLQSARSDAMNGQYGQAHGVAFNPVGFEGYVVFVGDTFTHSVSDTRHYVPSAPSIMLASGTPAEVVFVPVSGEVAQSQVIGLQDRYKPGASTTIIVNETGYVGW